MGKMLWQPSEERVRNSNMYRFMSFVNDRYEQTFTAYDGLYAWSVNHIPEFWAAVWDFVGINASRSYDRVIDHEHKMPGAKWFPGARLNFAEQFSGSITDFFDAISLDNTGTYLNGYMLVDAKNNETGLVEMSYRCFVYYRSTGGPYTVSSKSLDGNACSTEYDSEMVTADYLMGINYPASQQVRDDLKSTDNRPAGRRQLKQLLPGVNDVETAKTVIT